MTPTAVLTGHSIVAGAPLEGTAGTVVGRDPATGEELAPAYSLLAPDQVAVATAAAHEALDSFSALAPEAHARFLERVADNIEAVGDAVVDRAKVETGLPEARLRGELARTTGQLRLFAAVVRQGGHHGVRIDPAQPDRTPLPRVDIRQRKVPVGPVAVFGASNFPLAFSTAGGDTASALAAGCPVVVKAHSAHLGTGELVGRAVADAVEESGLHPGVFSLVHGPGTAVGRALVTDPVIQAVGFTGSRSGGLALVAAAASRPVPIPVYAEMSSVNPVVVLPGAVKDDVDGLAQAYLTSVTGSSGQLCTAPGVVLVPRGDDGDAFVDAVGRAAAATTGQTMLTAGIAAAWHQGVDELAGQDGVERVGAGTPGAGENAPAPQVFVADVATFLANPVLEQEIFGAASLVVRYADDDELLAAVGRLEGQLTATLHLTAADTASARRLLPVLERKVGRILVNGWPTGVEVGHAMVHGGPFPATSDGRSTSVGTLAIERFLRPVAYQNLPEELLPAPLRTDNPWHLDRLVDGRVELGGGAA
jgi:alpha-ketoglutaric semialdehyde dehydrogenase